MTEDEKLKEEIHLEVIEEDEPVPLLPSSRSFSEPNLLESESSKPAPFKVFKQVFWLFLNLYILASFMVCSGVLWKIYLPGLLESPVKLELVVLMFGAFWMFILKFAYSLFALGMIPVVQDIFSGDYMFSGAGLNLTTLSLAGCVLSVFVFIYYFVHVLRNSALNARQKLFWLGSMLGTNFVGVPVVTLLYALKYFSKRGPSKSAR